MVPAQTKTSLSGGRVPAGCHLIGMTAKNGHSRPTFSTLVIRAGGRDIAPPERFELVWWQERGKRRFWCWRPIPPAGYVSLGDVGTTSETPPSHKDVACVALACLSPSRQPLGGQIWNDRGRRRTERRGIFEHREAQGSSDAAMTLLTTSHAASSPFLRERRLPPYNSGDQRD